MNSTTNWIKPVANKIWIAIYRRRKAIAITFITVVVLHGLVTVFLDARVKSELAKLKATGQPTIRAELATKAIPDNENGAVVFAQAFEMMQYKDSKGIVCLRKEYGDADIVFANYLDPVQREKDPSLWSKAQQASVSVAEVLNVVERAAAYQKCQFPVHWEKIDMLPHYSLLRRLTRFASARASLEASVGNSREAAKYLDLAFRINNAINDEPIIISPLVRIATIKIAFGQLGQVLDHCNLDAQSINMLDATLSRIDLASALATAMRGERANGISFYSDVADPKTEIHKGFSRGAYTCSELPFWTRWMNTYTMRPVLYMDELAYIRSMSEIIKKSSLPYKDILSRNNSDRWPVYAPIRKLLCPAYSRVIASENKGIAMIAVSRTALALAVYKNQFGSYPQSIDELESKLKRKMPEDPFTGRQLIYKPQNSGYVLYSIGDDMKDNGGSTLMTNNEYDVALVVNK